MSPGKPLRIPRFAYVGMHRYFVTICTSNRLPIFNDVAAVETVLIQLLRCASRNGLAPFAYCFMPDHLHTLLVAESDTASVLECVRLFKQVTAFVYRQQSGRTLWQTGFFERVLRDSEETAAVARYILENPVRAGLTRTFQEYPFSGSAQFTRGELAALWEEPHRRV